MPTVSFRTLGCRLNQAETDQMAEQLSAAGFEVVADGVPADVVIVNSCTVTQEATRSSRRTAARAGRDHPGSLVVVAGCYAVAERDETAGIEGVGLVVSNDEKERIAGIVAARLGAPDRARPQLQIGTRPPAAGQVAGPSPGMGRNRVNLKVQTGCDEWCTFCIIPSTRGPLRSYAYSELLAQARAKVAEGARELVLTGVHLGKYGWDEGRPDDALLELLEGLLAIDGLSRIRLSSILARHVTPRLVDLIASEPRLCRFLHIPLQAGDDQVLERMHRPYRIAEYERTIELVRERIPGIALSTDVIVGFPGETPAQFERTLDVVRRAEFLKLHVFRYSPRPGTPSAAWTGQVPEEEKRRRSKELIALGNELRRAVHEAQVGRSREVLVEEGFDNGDLVGHTDDFIRVRFPGPASLVERLARVRVSEAGVESVRGIGASEVAWEEADPRDLRLQPTSARPA